MHLLYHNFSVRHLHTRPDHRTRDLNRLHTVLDYTNRNYNRPISIEEISRIASGSHKGQQFTPGHIWSKTASSSPLWDYQSPAWDHPAPRSRRHP